MKPLRILETSLIVLLMAGINPASAEEVVDGIAAQVGSDVVLLSEVYSLAAPTAKKIRSQGGGAMDLVRVHEEALDRLIDKALVRQVVEKAELDSSDSEVDKTIGDIAAENQLSVDDLRTSVEAQGMAYEDYREKIRDEIEQSKVIHGMVTSQVRVDESELMEVYEKEYANQTTRDGIEVHIRQILIPFAVNPDACAAVTQSKERILSGEPFHLVASQVSAISPERGGDLGWIALDELSPWMREITNDMSPGDMSNVTQVPMGCTLLEFVDRREASSRGFSDVREEIFQRIRTEKASIRYREFLDEMKGRTYVDRRAQFSPRDFQMRSSNSNSLF